jgi:NAD(P)H-hydrate epimerase
LRRLSRKDSRDVDRRAFASLRIPSICLMENAGAEAARVALELLGDARGRVVCVCGPGGNGGDGMVVARRLAIERVDVEILRFGASPEGDSRTQASICEAMGLPMIQLDGTASVARAAGGLSRAALIVDALYGTGLTRALDGDAAALVEAMNASGAPVLALDVPSGLDCDTGRPFGACVRAAVTVTFVAEKAGFADPGSRAFTGEVRVAGIGAPAEWPPPR